MAEAPTHYYVNKRRVALRRSEKAALLQMRAGAARAALTDRLRNWKGLTFEEASSGRMIARGEAHDVEAVSAADPIDAVRDVYVDPQGVEIALTDEVAIGFRPDVSDERRRELCRRVGLEVVATKDAFWTARTVDPGPSAALTAANRLAEDEQVLFAEPNALQAPTYHAANPPANEFFGNQWYLWESAPGATAHIDALEAWGVIQGKPDIRVVIHDTGVDERHPALAPNLLPGKSYGDAQVGGSPIPFLPNAAHGTACAGIVGGAWDIGGIVGVAPFCRIVPVRIQKMVPFTTFVESIEWAAQHGEILLGSWVIAESSLVTAAIEQAARFGRQGRGLVCVFSSGNDAKDGVSYPAKLSTSLPVIAVGASTNHDAKAPYGNWGDGLDLLAPSSGGSRGVETADIVGESGYNRDVADGDYCRADDGSTFGGTSAAAAVVAGVAALMLSINSGLTSDRARDLLRQTAKKIENATAGYAANGWSRTHGYGRLEAGQAVHAAQTAG